MYKNKFIVNKKLKITESLLLFLKTCINPCYLFSLISVIFSVIAIKLDETKKFLLFLTLGFALASLIFEFVFNIFTRKDETINDLKFELKKTNEKSSVFYLLFLSIGFVLTILQQREFTFNLELFVFLFLLMSPFELSLLNLINLFLSDQNCLYKAKASNDFSIFMRASYCIGFLLLVSFYIKVDFSTSIFVFIVYLILISCEAFLTFFAKDSYSIKPWVQACFISLNAILIAFCGSYYVFRELIETEQKLSFATLNVISFSNELKYAHTFALMRYCIVSLPVIYTFVLSFLSSKKENKTNEKINKGSD